jgi:hypothetical protein
MGTRQTQSFRTVETPRVRVRERAKTSRNVVTGYASGYLWRIGSLPPASPKTSLP